MGAVLGDDCETITALLTNFECFTITPMITGVLLFVLVCYCSVWFVTAAGKWLHSNSPILSVCCLQTPIVGILFVLPNTHPALDSGQTLLECSNVWFLFIENLSRETLTNFLFFLLFSFFVIELVIFQLFFCSIQKSSLGLQHLSAGFRLQISQKNGKWNKSNWNIFNVWRFLDGIFECFSLYCSPFSSFSLNFTALTARH